jgi:hypothetical protein
VSRLFKIIATIPTEKRIESLLARLVTKYLFQLKPLSPVHDRTLGRCWCGLHPKIDGCAASKYNA